MEASMPYDEDLFAWGVIAAVFIATGIVFWLPAIAYAWF
jgi:mannitol-specific phosphotransferase system IIBC component